MKVCNNYRRPEGVMGGPCMNCGRSQPEHARARATIPDERTNRHNRVTSELVDVLRKNNIEGVDILVIGESFLVGLALLHIKLGGDNECIDAMCMGAKARLAEIRLKDAQPKGAS